MARQNAELAILARNQASAQQEARLEALRDVLQMNEPLVRIECFDISHTQGESAVASLRGAAEGNAMQRRDYRRFNIRDITPGDDYAAMRQAVLRRYDSVAGGEGKAPDLILIDGGKGQVAAWAALVDLGLTHLNMLGVAGRRARKPTGKPDLPEEDGRATAQPANRPSGPAPDSGSARRSAPFRHYRPPRAARVKSRKPRRWIACLASARPGARP